MNNKQRAIFEDFLKKERENKSEKPFAELFQGQVNEIELKRLMKTHWESVLNEDIDAPGLSPVLHKIHYLINTEEQSSIKTWWSYRFIKWYSRVAAIILLPLLIGLAGLYYYSVEVIGVNTSMVEVVAPPGSRVHAQLPDGSKSVLNSGSVLKYEVPFDERRVELEGEAFFDIKNESSRTFIVEGKNSNVEVFGTRFNVRMWPDEDLTEVVLEKGKVALIPDEGNEIFQMTPGEMLVYNNADGSLKRENVNPEKYSAWIDGKLMLRGENMKELSRELSRWFNVEFEVEENSMEDYTFRATFKDENLEEVLRLLKLTSPIEYEIIDSQKQNNGSFSKKKVIIRHE